MSKVEYEQHATEGKLPLDKIFKECFIEFTNNSYANTHRVADFDNQWKIARENFAKKINEAEITSEDFVEWINHKAYWMIRDEKAAEENRKPKFSLYD